MTLLKILWTDRAEKDLISQESFIAKDKPRVAVEQIDRLITRAASLADYAEQGRAGRVKGTRELVVSGTPFILVYRVRPARIEILRVLHGKQKYYKP